NLTRLPFELGCSPSAASMTPAFTSSSLNFPISVRIFSSGSTPASESLSALTITITRIVISPYKFSFKPGRQVNPNLHQPSLYKYVERGIPKSTHMMHINRKFITAGVREKEFGCRNLFRTNVVDRLRLRRSVAQ